MGWQLSLKKNVKSEMEAVTLAQIGIFAAVLMVLVIALWLVIRKGQRTLNERETRAEKRIQERLKHLKPAKKIEWSEDFVIDNGIIDSDHKLLIDLINEFNENIPKFREPKDMSPYLYALKKYTQTHFAREEKLQRAVQFFLCDEHAQEHEEMIRKLDRKIKKALAANEANLMEVAVDVGRFLTNDWMVSHIIENDMSLQPYIENMKERAADLTPLR